MVSILVFIVFAGFLIVKSEMLDHVVVSSAAQGKTTTVMLCAIVVHTGSMEDLIKRASLMCDSELSPSPLYKLSPRARQPRRTSGGYPPSCSYTQHLSGVQYRPNNVRSHPKFRIPSPFSVAAMVRHRRQ